MRPSSESVYRGKWIQEKHENQVLFPYSYILRFVFLVIMRHLVACKNLGLFLLYLSEYDIRSSELSRLNTPLLARCHYFAPSHRSQIQPASESCCHKQRLNNCWPRRNFSISEISDFAEIISISYSVPISKQQSLRRLRSFI